MPVCYRRDDADTGNAHQPARRLVPFREAANLAVELALLATDMLMDRKQWIDDGSKRMTPSRPWACARDDADSACGSSAIARLPL